MFNFNSENKLDKFEVEYWTKFFSKNLKIGVEIECDGAGGSIRHCQNELQPTNDINKFGDFGVYKVTSDGSLNNGIEICTVGRRVDFRDMVCQYKYIIDNMDNTILNSRCGLHNHMLVSYGSRHSELEKTVPDLILKNFLQLVKIYYSGMVWITSTVYQPEHDENSITRGHKFCDHDSLYTTNIITNSLSSLKSRICNSGRYKAINLNPMHFREETIDTFHMELRFPDGSLYPVQIASQNVLYQALMIKAIKLSRFGIITTQDVLEEAKELSNAIRNEYTWNYDNRLSRTPSEDQINRIKSIAHGLLDMIKEEITEISKDAYDVLKFLADKPISMMLREEDVNIDETLLDIIKKNYQIEEENEDLLKAIACTSITGVKNEDEWLKTYSSINNLRELDVCIDYAKLKRNYNFKFDEILGGIK